MDLLEFQETAREIEREKTWKVILVCSAIVIITMIVYSYL